MKEYGREGTVIQVLSDIRQLSTYAHTTHLIQTQLQAGIICRKLLPDPRWSNTTQIKYAALPADGFDNH